MYTLRQATEADYAFLYHLPRATMKDYVAQTWGWDETVQAAMFKERFNPGHSQIVVIDGRDVGVLSIPHSTAGLTYLELMLFYVIILEIKILA